MKISIEKKRLFNILEDLDFIIEQNWTYTYVYRDDEAIQVLADMGLVKLTRTDRPAFTRIHLKDEFLTQVGLALFREHDENTD